MSIKAKLSRHVMRDEQDGGRDERKLPDSDRPVVDGGGDDGKHAN